MAFWDRWRKKKPDNDYKKTVHMATKSAYFNNVRQKQTMDKWEKQFYWYQGTIPRNELKSPEILETLNILKDINPDTSLAIWNLLRLANGGHGLEVEKPSGAIDRQATEYLNDLAKRVGTFYGGGVDQLINVLLMTCYVHGAVALEVEVSEGLDEVVDFHPVDPSTLDFRRNKATGELELVQKQQDGNYKVLNQETVFYYPLDPEISDPFGRSPILPILSIVFFQTEVLKDLKKVIHHQGHQRFDIKVLEEAIIQNMPDQIKVAGPGAVREFVTSYVADVQSQMANLEPDDDFFHTDSVEIQMAGGAIGQSLDASRVIDIINQQVVSALKQLPILLGRNEGSTETHSTVQWQIYVAGIESMRRAIKRLLERAYNVSLQIGGFQGNAKLTFDSIRVSDRYNDARAEQLETNTRIQWVNQGWITNDEAAMEIVGHPAVEEPKQMITQAAPAQEEEPPEEDEEEARILKVYPFKKKGMNPG